MMLKWPSLENTRCDCVRNQDSNTVSLCEKNYINLIALHENTSKFKNKVDVKNIITSDDSFDHKIVAGNPIIGHSFCGIENSGASGNQIHISPDQISKEYLEISTTESTKCNPILSTGNPEQSQQYEFSESVNFLKDSTKTIQLADMKKNLIIERDADMNLIAIDSAERHLQNKGNSYSSSGMSSKSLEVGDFCEIEKQELRKLTSSKSTSIFSKVTHDLQQPDINSVSFPMTIVSPNAAASKPAAVHDPLFAWKIKVHLTRLSKNQLQFLDSTNAIKRGKSCYNIVMINFLNFLKNFSSTARNIQTSGENFRKNKNA